MNWTLGGNEAVLSVLTLKIIILYTNLENESSFIRCKVVIIWSDGHSIYLLCLIIQDTSLLVGVSQ